MMKLLLIGFAILVAGWSAYRYLGDAQSEEVSIKVSTKAFPKLSEDGEADEKNEELKTEGENASSFKEVSAESEKPTLIEAKLLKEKIETSNDDDEESFLESDGVDEETSLDEADEESILKEIGKIDPELKNELEGILDEENLDDLETTINPDDENTNEEIAPLYDHELTN